MPEAQARKSILVIDDEMIVRLSCQRVIVPAGYELQLATSGPEGIELLKARHYDLIITDFKMPHMDGIEVLANIKRMKPDARTIIFTGYLTEATLDKIREAGADLLLEKPFNPADLLAAIRQVIG